MSWLAALGAGFGKYKEQKHVRSQVRANRRFQERMSNTEIQRRMEDMRRAGINPVLAASYGASSPSGSVLPSPGNVGEAMVNAYSTSTSTALAKKRMKQELQNMEATEELTRAQAVRTAAETQLATVRERLAGFTADIAEPAAFFLQSLMSTIPEEIRSDPRKVKKFVKDKIVEFASGHVTSAQQQARFIGEATALAMDLFTSGAGSAARLPKARRNTKSGKFYEGRKWPRN